MFYKRISDLHPLGKPTGDTWSNIEPIDFDPINLGNKKAVNGPGPTPSHYNYNAFNDATSKHYYSPTSEITELNEAFRDRQIWYNGYPTTTKRVDYNKVTITPLLDPIYSDLSSEYEYAKSLWFEVNVAKDENNVPVSIPNLINKYQTKRMNAYLMLTHLDEISADYISAKYVYASNASCDYLSAKAFDTNAISTQTLYNGFAELSSLHANTITAIGISSQLGIFDNISGDNLFYKNGQFTNITVTDTAELTAVAAYWADVAEIYTADKCYPAGTMVKFGGEKEITIANDKANAVVSEKPAITLNSGNKEEFATPIVLTGRSYIRTIYKVNKFDKIYLSEFPGIGCTKEYKISTSTTPIGIALDDKPYDEEGLVECIIQLNFE